MRIKAIIVDDEIEGINTLDYMISEYCPSVEVIGKYESSVEALKVIKRIQPDLIFLDIKMPHINGLELLELLGDEAPYAIFTTAYDDFVLQALRLNALDYLKKPVGEKELVNAVSRIEKGGRRKGIQEQITNALEMVTSASIGDRTKVGIKEGNKVNFVSIGNISHCKSDGNFTNVYLFEGNKKMIYSSYALGALEDILPAKYFFRIHREYIVNGLHIKEYDRSEGGSVVINNGDRITVSRGRREDFIAFAKKILHTDDV